MRKTFFVVALAFVALSGTGSAHAQTREGWIRVHIGTWGEKLRVYGPYRRHRPYRVIVVPTPAPVPVTVPEPEHDAGVVPPSAPAAPRAVPIPNEHRWSNQEVIRFLKDLDRLRQRMDVLLGKKVDDRPYCTRMPSVCALSSNLKGEYRWSEQDVQTVDAALALLWDEIDRLHDLADNTPNGEAGAVAPSKDREYRWTERQVREIHQEVGRLKAQVEVLEQHD